MKSLMRFHRYLSCFVAPAMIFFAVTGAWQAFRFHDSKKDGSYTAPAIVSALSRIHMADDLEGAGKVWFRAGEVGLAAAFLATAIVGLIMAFRMTRPAWLVWLCLLGGVAIPVALAFAAGAI